MLLNGFLDYVERNSGELLIVGDLLELWYCRLESVLSAHAELFDRLAEMNFTYILGNHDEDLANLQYNEVSPHRLFEKISPARRTVDRR